MDKSLSVNESVYSESTYSESSWINDPVQTESEQERLLSDPRSAADIAHVTAVPMHHPDSLYLKLGSDLRNGLFMGGAMFVMQVAHPKVGAGVGQFSNFREDPWHRLREIAKSGENYIFKGKQAGLEEGRRLRELHRNIKGVDSRGEAYHSLNPKVYGWVHTSFLYLAIRMCELYDEPLSREQQQTLFLQWQEGGHVFGLRNKDMPYDIDDYFRYVNEMIEQELEYNEVMGYMLSLDENPPVKPSQRIPDFLWKALWKRLGKVYRDFALFGLPVAYREKIAAHQPWTEADQKRMQKRARRIRFLFRFLPERFRYDPKGYAIMKSSQT